ncbi:MAG TPA: hypothetical protein VN824_15015 [Puia sp.]|nr:hypothetical protein [Puia sp.]
MEADSAQMEADSTQMAMGSRKCAPGSGLPQKEATSPPTHHATRDAHEARQAWIAPI